MSGMEDVKEQEQVNGTVAQESEKSMPSSQEEELVSGTEDVKEREHVDGTVVQESENSTASSQEEEAAMKKKYGGIKPKKPPLISKDHERAYFDSADWALGKQGVDKPKGPLAALRPKLQISSTMLSISPMCFL